jgi:hypothetical protein
MRKPIFFFVSAMLLLPLFGGCAGEIAVAPPPSLVEVVPPQPFVGAVWTGGYWDWRGGRHVWIRAHYERPRYGRVWVAHRWQRTGRGWRAERGHWERRW